MTTIRNERSRVPPEWVRPYIQRPILAAEFELTVLSLLSPLKS